MIIQRIGYLIIRGKKLSAKAAYEAHLRACFSESEIRRKRVIG